MKWEDHVKWTSPNNGIFTDDCGGLTPFRVDKDWMKTVKCKRCGNPIWIDPEKHKDHPNAKY